MGGGGSIGADGGTGGGGGAITVSDQKDFCKRRRDISSLGRYVFGSEISYNKAPPRLPGLAC